MTSALSSWKSRRESKMMSPWLIQTLISRSSVNGSDAEGETLGHAHLFPHLSPYVRQPFLSIETLGLQAAIPQHLGHLRVLLTILSEHQLSLVVVVLVLSTSSVLSSLRYSIFSASASQRCDRDGGSTFPLFCSRSSIKSKQKLGRGPLSENLTLGMLSNFQDNVAVSVDSD
jgi:hypothetical protein